MRTFLARHRRGLAVIAGALLGLVGTLTVANPASAHHSTVSGTPVCDEETGEWVITWTVNSFAPPHVNRYRLVSVESTPSEHPVDGIAVTEGSYPHRTSTPLVGEQRVPGTTLEATLKVKAEWQNGFVERKPAVGSVEIQGFCERLGPPPVEPEPSPPTVTAASTCDELIVVLDNPQDGQPVSLEVTTSAGDSETVQLDRGATETLTFPAADGLTYRVSLFGQTLAEGGWQNPGDCETEVEVPIASLSDCESLTIEVTNPLTDQTLTVTISSGEVTEELTIDPESTGEVTFPAEEGTVATVTIAGESVDIEWTQPEDCEPGEPAPSEEPEPSLPVTGGRTPLVIGAAVLLLLAGGGLFWAARRRKVTFTS